MLDSQSRTEQKLRDERAKEDKQRMEDERVIQESKMLAKQRRQQQGTRKFSKFMEDQITFQFRRQENLKKAMYEECSKATYTPKITERSRRMMQSHPQLGIPAHKRLYQK